MSRRPRIAIPLAALALALLDAPTPARAYKCISSGCPAWCETVPYGLTVASTDLGAATSESELRRAMDDWTRVSCTSLRDTWTGRSSATAGTSGDGQAVIGWVESGWRHDSNAIGVTGPSWNPRTNCISEADMELNGVHYTWTTAAGRGGTVNAYSIALHEGGHYYGLGHSDDPDATMYFAYSGGIDSLTTDDQHGICALYPGGGGGTDPGTGGGTTPPGCTSTGCPPGQTCTGGSCVAATGDGSVCASCSSDADCGGASDYCWMYPDGAAYCGTNCSSSADCPSGSACADLGGGYTQCVGVDASGSASCAGFSSSGGGTTPSAPECTTDSDCAGSTVCRSGACQAAPSPSASPLGASCASNADCATGTCLTTASGSFCTQTCDWLTPTSCPGGFYCSSGAIGGCDTGVCIAGSAGSVAMGGDCSHDTDCASLFCDAGTCTSPCVPGAVGCPSGMTCQVGSSPGCGACGTAAFTGEPCATNNDCASRMCAFAADGSTFCTARCASDGECPAGMSCQNIGSDSVCVPGLGSPSSPPPDDPDVPPGTDPSTDLPGGRPDGTSGTRPSGGCSIGGPGSTPAVPVAPVALSMLLLGLALNRRRF